ncbi:hypothetical protein [Bacillus alkalicellulosilyticus]|uniref:hypothetical protein n=1 Tax=Alkalihalobacterium alkalicellulosilyticum TaxID=1912214 RepID=UPI000997ED45|nr:hypothetical protein [Bacillus alkalicellulosilyticus]
MKSDKIRGASIHVTGSGLAYYIHFAEAGTRLVTKEQYDQALIDLEYWSTQIHENKREATYLRF